MDGPRAIESHTILVVEDNPITRKMVRVALEAAGYSVLEAPDGRTALDLAAIVSPALVIQDLVLPDIDGFDLLQRLRELPGGEKTLVLAFSGLASGIEQARASHLPFTDYLFKPVEPSRLIQTIETYLPKRQEATRPGQGRRVLVVDDDAVQLRLTKLLLEGLGFRVTTASDGVDALEKLREGRPDIILSEVLMPRLDGFRFCLSVRRNPELERVPVVLASAVYTEKADRELAASVGASAFVLRTHDCRGVTAALIESLERPLPPPTIGSVEELVDKYNARLIQQLERHAQLVLNLTSRLALREAELSVLSGFAASLTKISSGDAVLREMLYRCLDAAGASRGAILLREPDGSFALETQLGYDETETGALRETFHRSPILARMLERRALALPLPGALAAESRRLLDQMQTGAALIAPISAGGDPLGALVIGSSARKLDENWRTFLSVVATQIGQAILLIRGVSRLAMAEEKYRRIFDNAAVGIFQSTPDGTLLTANGTLVRMLGYDSGEELKAAVGTGFAQLYVDPGRRTELIRQFESSDIAGGFESLVRCKDSHIIWVSETVRAIRETGGGIGMLEGVVEDITARKRAEQATTALAEIGRTLSESLDLELIGRLMTESVCKLLDARSAVVYRLDPESGALVLVVASSNEAPSVDWMPRVDPGIGLAAIAVRDRRVVASPDVAQDPRPTYTLEMLARFKESPHRALLAIPLLVRDRLFGVLAVSDRTGRAFTEIDIDVGSAFADRAALALENARLYAEAERRRREAEVLADLLARISGSPDLDTTLQRVAEGARELCQCDQAEIALRDVSTDTLVFRYWTGTTSEGYSRYTVEPGKGSGGQVLLARRPFRTANYAEDSRITKDYVDSIRANPVIAQLVVPILVEARVEGLIYAENRSPRAFTEADEAILTRLAGHATVAIGNARHRETLVQTEKLATMGQLLAGVAHELNNPLTVVLGRAAMLQELLAGQPTAEQGQKISEAAKRCGRIVKNFLALARQRPPERHVVSLNDIVKEAVELMAYPLRVDDVEVRLDLSQDLPQLWADPYQLHQVLVNLISNAHQAMRATPPPRRLTLRSRHESTRQRVLLEAADTGPGIPPQIATRIFEPFFTTKPEGQGTGLGLSICKEMIEEHGGLIGVEGRQGQGAVFTVELPVQAPPATSDSARAQETPVPISGKTILVVDDEVEIAGLLSEVLSMRGYRVDTACNGIEALQKLEERRYDVILSDMRMPGMDGPALYRELERRHPDLLSRLVFLTGDTLSPETHAMLKEAVAPSLSKPLNFPEVLEVIQQVLEGAAA